MQELERLIESLVDDPNQRIITVQRVLAIADERGILVPAFGLSLHRLHLIHLAGAVLKKIAESRNWNKVLSYSGKSLDRSEIRSTCEDLDCRTIETMDVLFIEDVSHATFVKLLHT